MKLSISNLAFPSNVDAGRCAALYDAGVRGLEVAPTKIASWSDLSRDRLTEFRQMIEGQGLQVSSLQAIFFNVPDAQLLQDEEQFDNMLTHVRRVSSVAATLGAGVMVFGAPKQRLKGGLSADQAFELGAKRLSALAESCAAENIAIALEPVPEAYGGDFLQSWQEVKRMVETVASDHLAVHLDTACVALGGGDIVDAIASTNGQLRHFHIAEPGLGSFRSPSSNHALAADQLRRSSFAGWLAIEMLGKADDAWEDALHAVAFARRCYGAGDSA